MKKLIVMTIVFGLLISMVGMVGAVENTSTEVVEVEKVEMSSARVYVDVEEGLYKVVNYSDGTNEAYVEVKKGNGEVVPFYVGTGERYIELKGKTEYVMLYNTDIVKVEEVEEVDNDKAVEGVYVVGKDLKEGVYTFMATTENGGIVQKITTLEVSEGVEVREVFFIEAGEEAEVEVLEGEILQVILAKSK